MKKLNLSENSEKVTKGMTHYILLIAVLLIMFFAVYYVFKIIIDPKSLAKNALLIAKVVLKIGWVFVFMITVYKVFIESKNLN